MVVVAQLWDWRSRDAWLPIEPPSKRFFGVSVLLFAASAAVTIVWCTSMSAMGEMPMPDMCAFSLFTDPEGRMMGLWRVKS